MQFVFVSRVAWKFGHAASFTAFILILTFAESEIHSRVRNRNAKIKNTVVYRRRIVTSRTIVGNDRPGTCAEYRKDPRRDIRVSEDRKKEVRRQSRSL